MTRGSERSYRLAASLIAVVCVGVALSGCISLFPKAKPAQLYRFGAPAAEGMTPAAPAQNRFTVALALTSFDHASAGDQILSVSGQRTAYIAGARWVTSAATLFDDAVARTFEAHGGPARLLARGEIAPIDYRLKLAVRTFEARYDHGPGAAPTIIVELYAALDNAADAKLDRTRIFRALIPAKDNTVHAIAAAFDGGTQKVVGDLAAWVDARGAE